VGINWSGKRRWIAGLLLLAGFLVMFNAPPVIPIIQLPGEVYPSRFQLFGLRFTNTLIGSVLVWILIGLLIWYVMRRRPQSGAEVPRGGFYNMFEMLFEGLYGFIEGIARGPYLNQIFKVFFTIFIIVLLSNWQSLLPGVDSIGFLEPHLDKATGAPLDGYEVSQSGPFWVLNAKCPWVSEAATLTAEQQAARAETGCVTGTGTPLPQAEHPTEEGAEAAAIETTTAESGEHATEGQTGVVATEEEHHTPGDPNFPWHVLPFLRPPSTDLNLTVALALVAVTMTQVMGFRALGLSYLTKFFNFRTLFNSALGGIDVAVGLLELIGELARILSFAFRLLGNVFAGSVLLFVMSFLLPFLPWPFFILEFFVGIIQALVFGLLTAIFMNLATQSHHADDHHEEPGELAAEGTH
jgi:F-type H+-transporting ATPase subunit a